MSFYNDLLSRPIFKVQNQWLRIYQLYEPTDYYVKVFVPESYCLPKDMIIEPFFSKIKKKLKTNIELKYFTHFLTNNQNDRDSIKNVFEFINSVKDEVKKQQYLKSTLDYKWLMSIQDDGKLYKSSELWSVSFKDYIGLVEPVVDNSLVPTYLDQKLLIKNELNINSVFNNYLKIVSSKEVNPAVIKKIYLYFQNEACKSTNVANDLINKFEQKKSTEFIFTFDASNSFKSAQKLVLDLPKELGVLEPFLFSLNKSSNNITLDLENLFVKVFKVLPNVTLLNLIEILETIKSKSVYDFFMVNNIINYIDKFFIDEFLANEEFQQRILVPTFNNSNKSDKFDMDHPDKCVYLIEDDNNELDENKFEASKDKELKMCHLNLKNYKFLKRIGVKSFTEAVMSIENFFIEDYGLSEELTERIRNLLDGYKDGLAIFKEAIQNADDAGANVLKICYDKRKLKHLKSKLLDKCFASAQGPALLFYNDSIFTENDFKAIIKLGAGTKKESKEKIGKFGLGFNSFYNITVSFYNCFKLNKY